MRGWYSPQHPSVLGVLAYIIVPFMSMTSLGKKEKKKKVGILTFKIICKY